jgi:hypothetical protein
MKWTEENYRDVPGYEGIYKVSESGLVVMTAKCKKWGGVARNGGVNADGYRRISLTKNRKRKRWFVHQVVAIAFIGEISEGKQVNHLDGNKLNNHFTNLEIVSHKENMHHAIRHGLWSPKHGIGEGCPGAKLTDSAVLTIRRLHQEGSSFSGIARTFGVSHQTIRAVVRRETWRHIA